MPSVKRPRLRVSAEANHLLALTQKLDLLRASIRRDDVDENFCERFCRTKHDCALGRLATPHQHVTAFDVLPTHTIFDHTNRILVEDVEIELGISLVRHPVLRASGQVLPHISICSRVTFCSCCQSDNPLHLLFLP